MRGYKTVLELLKTDLEAERNAVKIYREFARSAASDETRSMLMEFARAEQGHANGLVKLISEIESGENDVLFYCPVCGWELNFGRSPEPGIAIRCRMCGSIFTIAEVDGDYELKSMDGK